MIIGRRKLTWNIWTTICFCYVIKKEIKDLAQTISTNNTCTIIKYCRWISLLFQLLPTFFVVEIPCAVYKNSIRITPNRFLFLFFFLISIFISLYLICLFSNFYYISTYYYSSYNTFISKKLIFYIIEIILIILVIWTLYLNVKFQEFKVC